MGKLFFALIAGLVLSIIFLLAGPYVAPSLTERIYCPAGTRIVSGSRTAYDPVARTNVTTHSTDCLDSAGQRIDQGFYGAIISPFLIFFVPISFGLWLLAWLVKRSQTNV
jgi:hypothetical protein